MNRHRRWVSDLICPVIVTGLPLMPAVATIVMGILLGGAVYGGYLWTGIKKTNPLPHTAEAHQVGSVTAEVLSHGSRTVRMSWISGSVFSRVRVRFIDVLPFTWSSALPATGASDFTVAGSNLTVNYEVQGCSPTNFNGGICSLWHSHVATGSVTFVERTANHQPMARLSSRYSQSDGRHCIFIPGYQFDPHHHHSEIMLDYIGASDGDGDLTVETGSSPHIRQMPLGTHTFRLTAYRYVVATDEEISTQAAGVFILTVEAGATPPTPTRTDTPTVPP